MKRKIFCGLVTFSLVSFFSVFAVGQEVAPKIKSVGIVPKQVLFVGNSYFYYNDSLHNKVLGLAKAADKKNEKQYNFKSVTISGAKLEHHSVESYVKPGAFGYKKPFDVIILAGASDEQTTPEKREHFFKTVQKNNEAIRASGAKTVLLMTWAYTKKHKQYDPKMTAKNREGYTNAGNKIDAMVIPAGLAFEEAYRRKPGIMLHQVYDGSHPSEYGSYLAACVVYACLYGKSPVGIDFDDHEKVDKKMAQFLQTVAWDTVKQYYGK